MNVTILSIFRNATHYLERYFEQMDDLQLMLAEQGHTLHLLLGYGDSTDGTGEALWDETVNRFDALLMDVSHGGRAWGSVENVLRFQQLAYCGNKLLDNVPPNADVVGIVESDLIWDALTLSDLIAHLHYCEGIAPMILDGPESFYDTYAFRKDGVRFTKAPPYHTALDRCHDGPIKIDSAGSVLFVRGDLARLARLSDGEAIVGFCKDIYQLGGSIWLDSALSVAHSPFNGKQRHAHRAPRAHGLLRHGSDRQVYS
jgi:hypothetical protein